MREITAHHFKICGIVEKSAEFTVLLHVPLSYELVNAANLGARVECPPYVQYVIAFTNAIRLLAQVDKVPLRNSVILDTH